MISIWLFYCLPFVIFAFRLLPFVSFVSFSLTCRENDATGNARCGWSYEAKKRLHDGFWWLKVPVLISLLTLTLLLPSPFYSAYYYIAAAVCW
jgi:hypothetical protein